jgi:hypothetical protein
VSGPAAKTVPPSRRRHAFSVGESCKNIKGSLVVARNQNENVASGATPAVPQFCVMMCGSAGPSDPQAAGGGGQQRHSPFTRHGGGDAQAAHAVRDGETIVPL